LECGRCVRIEVERALRVLDGAVLVLCGVAGVQSQSYTVDRQMRRYKVPRLAFINKLDRAGANAERVTAQLKDKLALHPISLQIQIGAEDRFEGVVDLIKMKAIYWDDATQGMKFDYRVIPAELQDQANEWHGKMVEMAAFENLPHLLCPIVNDMRRADRQWRIAKGIRNAHTHLIATETDMRDLSQGLILDIKEDNRIEDSLRRHHAGGPCPNPITGMGALRFLSPRPRGNEPHK